MPAVIDKPSSKQRVIAETIPPPYPDVLPGDAVMFYACGDAQDKGSPAIVTSVGHGGAVNLWIIHDNRPMPEVRLGARHMSDPDLRNKPNVAVNCGGWELSKRDRDIREILDWVKAEVK